jgi:hypothetical protein
LVRRLRAPETIAQKLIVTSTILTLIGYCYDYSARVGETVLTGGLLIAFLGTGVFTPGLPERKKRGQTPLT